MLLNFRGITCSERCEVLFYLWRGKGFSSIVTKLGILVKVSQGVLYMYEVCGTVRHIALSSFM